MRKSMHLQGMKKRILCLLLAVVMVVPAAGCGGQGASGDSKAEDGQGSSPTEGQQEGEQAIDDVEPSENVAMGRYVEEETDLSEYLDTALSMQRLSDGSIMILNQYSCPTVSKDNGVKWETMEIQWFKDREQNSDYISSLKAAPDGTIGAIYIKHEDDVSNAKCVLVKQDGTEIPIEVSFENDEAHPDNLWVSDTGRFFMTSLLDRNIYEIKEDGTSEIFLTPENGVDLMRVWGDLMVMDSYENGGGIFKIYDISKKEYIEDEVLTDFLADYYNGRSSNGQYWYDMGFFVGEDHVIYLAGKKGIHRHVIGGSAVEQLVDGGLSRLGSPEYSVVDFMPLSETEFLVLTIYNKIIKFTYDPNVPTVPNNRVKIYSLEENSDLRAAITAYQVKNPDMFIEYEIGIEEGSSVTRDDALKKLNTQIVAGEGPDLLCLNGLPVDSYVEKGLLLDVSSLVNDLEKEERLFENLFRAFEKDGGIYVVPGQVRLSLIAGREKYISNMKDLKTIADGVEELRKDNPGEAVLEWGLGKQLLKAFSILSAPAWKTNDGGLDRAALEEFLTQVKRMYETQMDGLDEKIAERYAAIEKLFTEERGENWMYNNLYYSVSGMGLMMKDSQLEIGLLGYIYSYYEVLSVARNKGFEDIICQPVNGQCSHVFMPTIMLGISAASPRAEYAQDFLKQFLSKDVQVAMSQLSVNKDALEELFMPNEDLVGENGEYGSISTSGWDDEYVSLNVYVPSQEQIDIFFGWMESMDTPYIEDTVLEETVFEEGSKFILGEQSIEEALNAIEQKMAIYLAE